MAAQRVKTNSQRVGNRWSVQEDGWRDLGSSHSPSSSSNLGSSGSPGAATDGLDHPVPGFISDSHTHSNPELQPEMRWWLDLQPNFHDPKDYVKEQSNVLEAIRGAYGDKSVYQAVKHAGGKQFNEEGDVQSYLKGNVGNLVDGSQKGFLDFMENELDDNVEEIKDVIRDDLYKEPVKEMAESWYAADEWLDVEASKCSDHEQPEKLYSELESQWIEVEKSGPWWRTTDKDDLPSLVSSKKLEQFENCDLPQPHSKHWSGPSECAQCFNQATTLTSLDQKLEREAVLDDKTLDMTNSVNSVSMFEPQYILDAVHHLPNSSERLICGSDGFATEEEEAESLQRLDSNLTKAQLLEALCHSQTRAREAEKAAQEAYDEKENIIKQFFRQASHLFAYRQWLQILQIETLSLQQKNNKTESVSVHLPGLLAFSSKDRKVYKGKRKVSKRTDIPNYQRSRGVVGFAVGLSLVGAGLLLGWTLGRLFPAL